MIRIEICLGSSCFARGGARYPAAVAGWLAARGLRADVRGRHCSKACSAGPTVLIDGVSHQVTDEPALLQMLERLFQSMPDPACTRTPGCMGAAAPTPPVPAAFTTG